MDKEKHEKLVSINKKLLKKKYVSIFLALFTLGVNIFAWFAFSANTGVELDATVASWDIEFKDNGEVVHNLVVEVAKIRPGMDDFTRTVSVVNNSDVSADFTYEISSVKLLGKNITFNTQPEILQKLESFYPFSVTLNGSDTVIGRNNSITFDMNVTWPYENTTSYYKIDDIYEYDSSLPYFKLNGSTYQEFAVLNDAVYNTNKNSLYLYKDDADSFFGGKCSEYEASTSKPCLQVEIKLSAVQSMGS